MSSFFDLVDLFKGDVEAATANVIFDTVINSFKTCNISLDNVIGFGSDGCNTMMGENISVMTRFKSECPGIFICKCICHSLHLCSSAACKELPTRVEDLPRDIHTFFKSSAKRKAVFKHFEEFCNVEVHKLLAPSQTRWLSLHSVVHRILEQWLPLTLYFTDIVSTEKLASAERILRSLKDPQVFFFFFIF